MYDGAYTFNIQKDIQYTYIYTNTKMSKGEKTLQTLQG